MTSRVKNHMGKAQPPYNVWTDGSYSQAHGAGGAGWLIRSPDGTEQDGYKPLPPLAKEIQPHGSDIAEIFAVGEALRGVPAGSSVRLRLDCQNVLDWLKAGRIGTQSKRTIPVLSQTFEDALRGVRSMNDVEFIKVGGRTNDELDRVHKLSRQATNAARPRT